QGRVRDRPASAIRHANALAFARERANVWLPTSTNGVIRTRVGMIETPAHHQPVAVRRSSQDEETAAIQSFVRGCGQCKTGTGDLWTITRVSPTSIGSSST